MEVRLQVEDRSIAILPNRGFEQQRIRKAFVAEDLRMHAGDQHLLVVGSVEDADAPPFRKITRDTPQKIMEQLGSAGMLEAEHLASLRIDPGHHMPDRTILPAASMA